MTKKATVCMSTYAQLAAFQSQLVVDAIYSEPHTSLTNAICHPTYIYKHNTYIYIYFFPILYKLKTKFKLIQWHSLCNGAHGLCITSQ